MGNAAIDHHRCALAEMRRSVGECEVGSLQLVVHKVVISVVGGSFQGEETDRACIGKEQVDPAQQLGCLVYRVLNAGDLEQLHGQGMHLGAEFLDRCLQGL
jgi:hypothetical protein